jgi:hypothetical protein
MSEAKSGDGAAWCDYPAFRFAHAGYNPLASRLLQDGLDMHAASRNGAQPDPAWLAARRDLDRLFDRPTRFYRPPPPK